MKTLEQLEADLAAVKGQWVYDKDLSAIVFVEGSRVRAVADFGKVDDPDDFARFICNAKNNMPALIAAAKALRAVSQDIDWGLPVKEGSPVSLMRSAIAMLKGEQ